MRVAGGATKKLTNETSHNSAMPLAPSERRVAVAAWGETVTRLEVVKQLEGIQITELYVNPGAAEKAGIAIPETVITRAKQVVK